MSYSRYVGVSTDRRDKSHRRGVPVRISYVPYPLRHALVDAVSGANVSAGRQHRQVASARHHALRYRAYGETANWPERAVEIYEEISDRGSRLLRPACQCR